MKFKDLQFLQKKSKSNKFGAKKTEIDGIKFDSKKESETYSDYKLELAQGLIEHLTMHPKFPIYINSILVCNVELDFTFFDKRVNKIRYIDVKAWDKKKEKYLVTSESRLKKKMVEAQYKIQVEYV